MKTILFFATILPVMMIGIIVIYAIGNKISELFKIKDNDPEDIY